uniref:Uncharacterized protein n=1 Tax=Angiostrongylus cantonensis TaxID=6313 RepID=A0A0K0CUV0_ANGCA
MNFRGNSKGDHEVVNARHEGNEVERRELRRGTKDATVVRKSDHEASAAQKGDANVHGIDIGPDHQVEAGTASE